ncbi:MAG: hypothetical protein CSA22_07810 [Deltaproteobacteria bacterium]|nr:MAG: hypothetical protein CSA22_07810 [Deltaproteobacteria bacterium]
MGNIVLSGNIAFLSLAELLQLLGTNNRSGVIRIKSIYSEDVGLMYLAGGNPVDAQIGSLSGVDAAYALFGWTKGEYTFEEVHVDRENVINQSRMEIILNGLRMLDDGMIQELGPVSLETIQTGEDGSSNRKRTVPVIRGPFIDYIYVVDEEVYHDRERIVEQGRHGNWIWVILEGMVDIMVDSPSDGEIKLVRLGVGGYLGRISSFLRTGIKRSATALAVGEVTIGVVDSQMFATQFAGLSPHLQDLVMSIDHRLEEVTQCAIDSITHKVKSRDFFKNLKLVIRQGDSEKRVFRINQGDAYIARRVKDGSGYVLLAKLHKGDCFGEVPFLSIDNEPKYASVYGSPDLKLSVLDIDQIRDEYDELPNAFKNMIEYTAICVSATTNIAFET